MEKFFMVFKQGKIRFDHYIQQILIVGIDFANRKATTIIFGC
jgi:hypothetical protein